MPAASRLTFKMHECPVCFDKGEPETFVFCKNKHASCRTCFPRLRSCPMCRASIASFTDADGHLFEGPCRNQRMGCNGDHAGAICPYELFNYLTPLQHQYLTFILRGLQACENPLFIWGRSAYPVLASLRHSWRTHSDLWQAFIPSTVVLLEVYDVIHERE